MPGRAARFAKHGGASTGAGVAARLAAFGTPSTAGQPARRSARRKCHPAGVVRRPRALRRLRPRVRADRIAKHQFVCAGLKAGPARDPVKVATAAAAVTAARAPRERTRAPPQPRGGQRWQARAKSSAPRAARGGGRRGSGGYSGYSSGGYSGYDDDTGGGGGGYGGGGGVTGLLPCPHCTRTFSQAAGAPRPHVPVVVAKPRRCAARGGPHSAAVSGWRRERAQPLRLAASRQSRTSGTFGAAPPRPLPTPHVLSGGGGGGGIDPSNRTSTDNPLIGGLGAPASLV